MFSEPKIETLYEKFKKKRKIMLITIVTKTYTASTALRTYRALI